MRHATATASEPASAPWLVVALVTAASGCQGQPERGYSAKVWADDDSGWVAWTQYVTLHDDGTTTPTGTAAWVHDGGRRALSPRDGDTYFTPYLDALFYMRSRGYVLVQLVDFDRRCPGGCPWLGVVALDADTGEELWSLATGWFLIPSPDGSILATVTEDRHATAASATAVELFDATDGSRIATIPVPIQSQQVSGITMVQGATWTPGGAFVVETVAGTEAVAVWPDGSVTPTDYPGCWYPQTTSSVWSSDGEALEGNTMDDAEFFVRQPFGCQDVP